MSCVINLYSISVGNTTVNCAHELNRELSKTIYKKGLLESSELLTCVTENMTSFQEANDLLIPNK